ncbi:MULTISPECIES: contractile injection system tape measure protein [Pseudomonas]|uniref:contractile injection system tape measure protein n=1 Tax=Pseudomonas TaxID=286 RepID=UPI000B35B485|nr:MULTISPECIES: contractile injection system tape measure protein [Pseudomonas]PMY64822.1 hypothetical protein C1Y31_16240 [Pseudomonas sp. FW305-25]PMY69258.1 hypothetical protein C1Y32_16990 [Pseudomonas sp. FW126-L8]PNA80053.1 hypothetical protein C1Y33_12550 [Pseudomonas sp. FW305-76]
MIKVEFIDELTSLCFIIYASPDTVEQVQQRCSDLFYQSLAEELCRLFQSLKTLSESTLSIDLLRIDVGEIPLAQFEEQLSQRLLHQLEQQILEAASQAMLGEMFSVQQDTAIVKSCGGEIYQEEWGTALTVEGVNQAEIAEQPNKYARLVDAQAGTGLVPLFHYLQSGYLASRHQALLTEWNASGGADNWLRSHLATSSIAQRQFFAGYCLQEAPRQRLLQTFSAASLQAVCRLFLDDKPELTPPAGKPALELCLLLSSLWACRQPSTGALPVPASLVLDSNLLTELAPWLLLVFGHPPLPAASLPWLQPFWQQPVVQQLLASGLSKPDFIHVQHQMEERAPQSEMAKRAPQAAVAGWSEKDRQHPAIGIGQLGGSQLQTGNAKQHAQKEMGERQRYTEAAVTRSNPIQLPRRSNASLLEQEPLSVANAGLVLLWPLLPGLWRQVGLLEEQQFNSPQAQLEAVCWLDGLVWGDEAMAEWRTPLSKLLCGLPLESPLVPWSTPEPEVREQLQDWLAAIPAQLPGLQRCQANDLRSLFLQRPGQLLQTRSGWQLSVETDASDFLLSQLPWALDFIRLPWMEQPLQVKWLPTVS